MMKIRLTLHMLAAAICPAALFLGGCSKSEDKSMQDAKAGAAHPAPPTHGAGPPPPPPT